MARQRRIEFPGATYHVVARGNNREAIVRDDTDVGVFVDSLSSTCRRHAWRVLAWCVMPNHYHMVLETLRGSLSRGMRQHNTTYAQAYNKRHHRSGHVFQGRYRAFLIAKEDYLLTVVRYVELNPCRASLVCGPAEWPWSSARVSLGLTPAPAWSAVRDVWARFGRASAESIARYSDFLAEGLRVPCTLLPTHSSLIIGDESDATMTKLHAGAELSDEIPVCQRDTQQPVDSFFPFGRDIDVGIKHAYAAGLPLRVIADFLGIHYTTVSVIARRTTPRKRGSTAALRAMTRTEDPADANA